jgi:hypothetical protein
MVTPGGGLRITFRADAVAFVTRDEAYEASALVFAVPDAAVSAARSRLTEVGPDRDALRMDGRGDVLIDLGLGRPAAFCVRTADPDLLATLRAHEGVSWQAVLPLVGPALVAASPDRVLCGPLGRAEVYNPIPAPQGRSPTGSHTHLIPDRLAHPTSAGAGIPPGWSAAVVAWVGRADASTKARIDTWAS